MIMINCSEEKQDIILEGLSDEIMVEFATGLRVFVNEVAKKDTEYAEWIKSVLADQLSNDFDAERIGLFLDTDKTSTVS